MYTSCPQEPTSDSVDDLTDEVISDIKYDFIVAEKLNTVVCAHNKVGCLK